MWVRFMGVTTETSDFVVMNIIHAFIALGILIDSNFLHFDWVNRIRTLDWDIKSDRNFLFHRWSSEISKQHQPIPSRKRLHKPVPSDVRRPDFDNFAAPLCRRHQWNFNARSPAEWHLVTWRKRASWRPRLPATAPNANKKEKCRLDATACKFVGNEKVHKAGEIKQWFLMCLKHYRAWGQLVGHVRLCHRLFMVEGKKIKWRILRWFFGWKSTRITLLLKSRVEEIMRVLHKNIEVRPNAFTFKHSLCCKL